MDYERNRVGETIRKRGVTIQYVQKEANFRMTTSFTYTPTQNNTQVFCIGEALTHNGAATICNNSYIELCHDVIIIRNHVYVLKKLNKN